MLKVVCECGDEIFVVLDIKVMGKAINEHAELHAKKQTDPSKAKAEKERIEEALTQKVIMAIAQSFSNSETLG